MEEDDLSRFEDRREIIEFECGGVSSGILFDFPLCFIGETRHNTSDDSGGVGEESPLPRELISDVVSRSQIGVSIDFERVCQ